jgi:hypothetical protein
MLGSSQFTPRFVTLEYCCYFMRFSEQNEPTEADQVGDKQNHEERYEKRFSAPTQKA